ncbi:unnamed protein product [Adineta ricciae]|uniref:Uncharacterized protein n=1 Tax=Adineta ricciae TaxID=249248 RepID=A0A815V8Y3_ADIRI|nr:unnamed protein product [Adineta ricciae]
MFKAYASSDSTAQDEEDKKPIVTSSNSNTINEKTWLENRSFTADLPIVSFHQPVTTSRPVVDTKPKTEEKKPIQPIVTKKAETQDEVFYVDRRRDRANITVQYTKGVPRYGNKFCNQRPLGSRIAKTNRKQRMVRYFHQKIEDPDSHSVDTFLNVDSHLKQLNITVREQPHSFDAWKELIDYQCFLLKSNGQQERLNALYSKQLAIAERALEQNSNRLQYRLLLLNLRTQSHLFSHEILLNDWKTLIKDCQKSSDDRTINETWSSYVQFLLNRIEIFSIEALDQAFVEYFSIYSYHIQTRSEKDRKFLINHMLDMFQIWTNVLHNAGYYQRAIGLYQTMIELHLDFTTEAKTEFSKRLESLEKTWNTNKARFGEHIDIENTTSYIDNELSTLSAEENRLFDSTYQSWIPIERLRMDFYQQKLLNHGIHFHSQLIQSLTDSSQIDTELCNISFQQSIRPFLFELNDQRQFLLLIIYYLRFLNALPHLTILQEILVRLKISLSIHLQNHLFLENEFLSLYPLIHPITIVHTEEYFSYEYISKVYEQITSIPSLKSYKIEFILLYWYYLARNIVEVKQQNLSLSKTRLKSLQTIIKKYLSLEEYRTCLRLYTHYGHLEYDYFQRVNDSRRIFDLCFQTIRTNPTNFVSYESYLDLCHWLSTWLACEFNLNHLFDQMLKIVLENAKYNSFNKQISKDKLCSSIQFVLKKLFPNLEFNNIITLVIECLKNRKKVSKWDQTNEQDWSTYLRQHHSLAFELLFIFLNYSYLLNDPFEKIHHIILNSVIPLINEQYNKTNQTMIDSILLFYVTILWNELFTEHLLFNQCTQYLKEIIESLRYPSTILWKFVSIYTCLLPLYGSYVNEFEQMLTNYKSNKKSEDRLMTKMFVVEMNLIRHIKIQRANVVNKMFNSGYEHRVRHSIRQFIQEYPYFVHLWLFYEYFEKYSPDKTRVKAVLYDSMQNCPWNKTLYMKSMSNAISETEWKLFLNVMLKSNVHILFSLEEFDMLKELVEMKN